MEAGEATVAELHPSQTTLLEVLATREGLSVSSFAVRELSEAARRADNLALLGDLPDLGSSADELVADVQAARTGR